MLNLLDPVELNGITIYRDDQDPRKFYPMPAEPWIPLDETGTPRFLFVKYIASQEPGVTAGPGGGYLQFTASPRLRPEQREALITGLRTRLLDEQQRGIKPFGRPITITEPLLASPSWVSGEVALHTWAVGETGLVQAVTGTTEPDLAGSLNASFAATLSPDGAEVFWDAAKRQKLPIILAYKLRYKARVSGASLRVDVKREKVRERVWTAAKPYLFDRIAARYRPLPLAEPYSKARHLQMLAVHGPLLAALASRDEVREIVKNEVDVEISIGEGGGEEGEGDLRVRLVELATQLLTEAIFPAFFGTAMDMKGLTDGAQAEALLEVKEQLEESLDPFHLELDQDTVVERGASPNGALSVLIPDEATRDRLMVQEYEGTFFSVLDVTVGVAGVDFEQDGIDVIKVGVRYEARDAQSGIPRRHNDDGALMRAGDTWHTRFVGLARDGGGLPVREYTLRAEVYYKGGLTSVIERRTSERQPLITPRGLGVVRVELLLSAPPADVEGARVDLRCRAPGGALFEERVELTQSAPRQIWSQHLGELDPDSAETAYEYRVTWRVPELGELSGEWTPSRERLLELTGPFQRTLTWTFRPQGSMEGVVGIFVDARYADEARGYTRTESFSFTKITDSHAVKVRAFADGPTSLEWEGRVAYTDGSMEELPRARADAATVWVGYARPVAGTTRRLTVTVNPMLLDFTTDLRLAVVDLSYQDRANGVDERAILQFFVDGAGGERKPQIWEFDFREAGRPRFSYTVRYVAQDPARSARVEVQDTDETLILLDRSGAVPA